MRFVAWVVPKSLFQCPQGYVAALSESPVFHRMHTRCRAAPGPQVAARRSPHLRRRTPVAFGRCSPLSSVKILTTSLCPAELHVYKESTVYTVYVAFDMYIQKSNILHRCAFCTEETFRKDTLRIMGHSCRTHMPQACTDWWKPVTTVCHNNASLYTYIPMEFIRPRQSTVVRPCSGYAWQPPGLRKELYDHNEATVSVNALNGLDRRLSFLQGKHQDVGRAIVGRHA